MLLVSSGHAQRVHYDGRIAFGIAVTDSTSPEETATYRLKRLPGGCEA